MTGRPLVAQIVTTLNRGGAQATVLASADMTEHGVDVVVLAGTDGRDDPTADTLWADPRPARVRVVPVPSLVRTLSPLRDLRCLLWLIRWLRANRPDVVHTHSSKAGVLGRVAAAVVGIPRVHTVHGWGPLHAMRRPVASNAARLERLLATLTGVLVVVGEADLRLGLANGIGRPGRYAVIRSGIDTEAGARAAQDRNAIRAELGLSDRHVIGMVARMAFPKDHATLIAAFERVVAARTATGTATGSAAGPEPVLVLIGDGEQRSAVQGLVAAAGLGDRVRFLGTRPDANRLVAGFDLAVLCSRWEGMPRSVVEAAAAAVPVVASDVGSVAELIEDGISGRLVPVGDVDRLAAAIVDARERPAAYRDMAELAQRRSAAFSEVRMRRELAELWRRQAGAASQDGPPMPHPAPERQPITDGQPVHPVARRQRRPILSPR